MDARAGWGYSFLRGSSPGSLLLIIIHSHPNIHPQHVGCAPETRRFLLPCSAYRARPCDALAEPSAPHPGRPFSLRAMGIPKGHTPRRGSTGPIARRSQASRSIRIVIPKPDDRLRTCPRRQTAERAAPLSIGRTREGSGDGNGSQMVDSEGKAFHL